MSWEGRNLQEQLPDPRVAIRGSDELSLRQYRQWLSETCRIVSVDNLDNDSVAAIEDTADVLILDCQYSDQGWKDCTDLIDLYATTSPIALITADVSTEPMANRQPISCVTEPITRSKIQETVERLYIEDIYSELIDHYFSLATRRAELETAQSQRTLREDPEYQMLLTDLCNLRRYADHRVEDILDRFDRRVFETI